MHVCIDTSSFITSNSSHLGDLGKGAGHDGNHDVQEHDVHAELQATTKPQLLKRFLLRNELVTQDISRITRSGT